MRIFARHLKKIATLRGEVYKDILTTAIKKITEPEVPPEGTPAPQPPTGGTSGSPATDTTGSKD
jgi:hypothetical protein